MAAAIVVLPTPPLPITIVTPGPSVARSSTNASSGGMSGGSSPAAVSATGPTWPATNARKVSMPVTSAATSGTVVVGRAMSSGDAPAMASR